MSLSSIIFGLIFFPLFAYFIFLNMKHNYFSRREQIEIKARPIYYILIIIACIWFTYVLLIGLDPHF